MASRKTSVWEKPLPSTIRGGRSLVSSPSTPSSSVGNTSTSQPPPAANSYPPITASSSSSSHLPPRSTETPSQNQPTVHTSNRRQAAHRVVSRIPLKTSPTPPIQSSMLNSPHLQSPSLQKSALSSPSMHSSASLSLSTAKPLSMAKTPSTAKLSSPTRSVPASLSSSKAKSLSTAKSSSMGKLSSSTQALATSQSSSTVNSSSGNAWITVRSKHRISKLHSYSSNINRSPDSMPMVLTDVKDSQLASVAKIPQDYVTISYEYNCGGTAIVPRHLPHEETIDITVKENVDPEDAVIEVSPARSANSATNVHIQTTWKAMEDKMMKKLINEMKNMEKRLKRQFKKDTQLFVDGALLFLMRNVEDMAMRKMMEVTQIPETASFGTIVEEFTNKFKCALTKDELQNLKPSSGRSNANAFAHLDPAYRETSEYLTRLIEYLSDHGRKDEEIRYRHYIDFAFGKTPIVRR